MRKQDLQYIFFNYAFAELDNTKANLPTDPGENVEFSIKEGYNPETSNNMPVTRQVMNGILYMASLLFKNQQAGRELNIYDATFSASIGGYPQDVVVKIYNNDGSYTIYKSLIDDNTYNPAVDNGTHWAVIRNYNNLYKDLSNLEIDGFKKMLEINRVSNCIIKGEVDVVYENNKLIFKIKAGTILASPNGIKNNSAEYDNTYLNISDDLNIDITIDYNNMISGACYFIIFALDVPRVDTSVNYFHGELTNTINNRYRFYYNPNNNILYNFGIRASNIVFLGYLSVNKDNNSIIYKKINYINTNALYPAVINYDFYFICLSGFGGDTNIIKVNMYGKYVVRVVNANYLYVNLYRIDSSSSTLVNVYRTGTNISELTIEVEIKEPNFGIMVLTNAQANVDNYIKFIPYLN